MQLSTAIPHKDAVETEYMQRNLRFFIAQAWSVVEPATPFVPGWHIDAICEFLMAMRRLEIRNGIINIPPRHMKSRLTSVFLPAWVWTTEPHHRWLTCSYADELATRDCVAMRRLILSPWYRAHWGDEVFRLTGDQNRKTRFDNDKSGYRLGLGVGSGGTGEGGDWIVVDDPLKALDAESDRELDRVTDWWSETMSTRGNNPKTARRLVIMQRLSVRDLTGYLESRMHSGGTHYETLILPAEYEPNRMTVAPDCKWRDPRSQPNELLWPERFGRAELDALKTELGSESAIAGQLQQRPVPKGGAIYREEWWKGKNRFALDRHAVLSECVATYLSVDSALKDKDDADYTAISVFALMPDYTARLIHVERDHLAFTDLVDRITEAAAWAHHADRHGAGKLRAVVIEDKGSGTSAIQTLRKTAPPWLRDLVKPFVPTGDKPYRARQAAVWCGRDCLFLPLPSEAAPWLFDFERELFNFPRADHDDMVDTFSQFIIYLEHVLADGWRARIYPQDDAREPDEFDDPET